MTTSLNSRPARSATLRAADEPSSGPRADWKRMCLITGLGILSWISTYAGLLELVQANMGAIDLPLKIALGMSVAMLMLMIIWLLDQIFSPISSAVKMLFICGYVFLSMISVGFGFGFYWKFLESRSEASRSAESAVTQVQSALHGAEVRLGQLITTLDTLTHISTQKAADEVAKGNSCPNSKPGDGPRRRLREADATRFSFASDFVKERIGAVKAEVGTLDTDLAKVVMQDASTVGADGTRNEFLRELGRKLDRAVTGFNAFRSDPQLKQFRADFAERAEKATFSDEQGATFACPDVQLQTALRGVVKAIDQLPVVEKPEIAAVEGAEATIEAFRRLLATAAGLVQFKLPPSADEIRAEQQRAIQSIDDTKARRMEDVAVGLGKRDWIPLLIAVFVDLCLLLVSFTRPMNRFQALVPKMRAAQEWPVIEILSKFHGIHEDETIRRTFEVLRHVVFNWRGVYYAAIPTNGGSAYGEDRESAELEAYLLSNLFTSFERERIFRPVPVTMFTTAYIQRKLSQQRSKYADVEAFRIYKFNDGAWPEMILGAVMGAAKRAEAEQARREEARLEAEAEAQKEIVRSEAARQIAEADAATERAKAESARLRAEADALRLAAKSKRRVWPFGRAGEGGRAEPTLEGAAVAGGPAVAPAAPVEAAAARPADPAYDVTRLVGEFTMLMRQQKDVIERQSAAIEELTRKRSADAEAPRPQKPEIRVVEGGAAGTERAARTYFRLSEAAQARNAAEPQLREPASVTPIHPMRAAATAPQEATATVAAPATEAPASPEPASGRNSILGWAIGELRSRAGERKEPVLPSLPALEVHEAADSTGSRAAPQVETPAAEPAVSSSDEVERFIATAKAATLASPSDVIALGGPADERRDDPSDRDLDRSAAAEDIAEAEAVDWPAEAEEATDEDFELAPSFEDLEAGGVEDAHPVEEALAGFAEELAADEPAAEDVAAGDEAPSDSDEPASWNQPDIDHDSITRWWSQGRDRSRRR